MPINEDLIKYKYIQGKEYQIAAKKNEGALNVLLWQKLYEIKCKAEYQTPICVFKNTYRQYTRIYRNSVCSG